MEKRLFGRTGHMSSIAIFGAAALSKVDQAVADQTMRLVLDAGVNHIDIAPSYGAAEERVGPWIPAIRSKIFLGCKTTERSREGAAAQLRASLKRLQTDHFDLYQIHAITTFVELDQVFAPGGALEAFLEAKKQGLTRFIGITGHGYYAPSIFIEALNRFDFDSVLFPLNFVQYSDLKFRLNAETLLSACKNRNVGTMIIKSACRGPWGELPHTHNTWYQPFTEPEMIDKAVRFALSQEITGICTSADVQILPHILNSCQNFRPMSPVEQAELLSTASKYEPLFSA